jgi:hypothetical protein
MPSKKPKSDLGRFREFVDAHVPGGTSHMSDADLAGLRDLVDPSSHPEVALRLVREMDALLESDDKRLEQWMVESARTSIEFGSIDEARSYLKQFRHILAENLARISSGKQGRAKASNQ